MNFVKSVAALMIILAAATFSGHNAYAEQPDKVSSASPASTENIATAIEPTNVELTVKQGDTLTRIASEYGVTVADIVAENGLHSPDLIEPGQILVLPKGEVKLTDFYGSLKAAAQAFMEPPAPQPVVAAPAPTAARTYTAAPVNGSSYYVGNGMWCTDYVHSRRPDIPIYGNAGYNWVTSAQSQGRSTGTAPQPGAVAVMPGHVAYVESVNSDGSYVVSEMGWNYKPGQYNMRTVQPGTFGKFIY